jgi:hypothetical protein
MKSGMVREHSRTRPLKEGGGSRLKEGGGNSCGSSSGILAAKTDS